MAISPNRLGALDRRRRSGQGCPRGGGARFAEKGGGHAMAAGVTICREKLELFRSLSRRDAWAESVAQARKNARAGHRRPAHGRRLRAATGRETSKRPARSAPATRSRCSPCPNHRINEVNPFGVDHLRVRVQAGDGAKLELVGFRSAQTALGQALGQGEGRARPSGLRAVAGSLGRKTRVSARLVDMALCQPGRSIEQKCERAAGKACHRAEPTSIRPYFARSKPSAETAPIV